MSTIQYSSSFDTLHSSKIYSLNWHKSSCLKKFSSHFMQHNMTFRWTSYCHHMQYRTMDLFEHRCQLLCWKRQQELVEPSPSLPASAIAELIACKNFQAYLFLLIQSYLQAHYTYIFYCCLIEIFEVIFVLLCTLTVVASAWACIVDSDNWSHLNK